MEGNEIALTDEVNDLLFERLRDSLDCYPPREALEDSMDHLKRTLASKLVGLLSEADVREAAKMYQRED